MGKDAMGKDAGMQRMPRVRMQQRSKQGMQVGSQGQASSKRTHAEASVNCLRNGVEL